MFAASDSVNHDDFRTYVEHQHLDEDFPGIQGIEFSLIVPPRQEVAHIAAIRKELHGKDVSVYAIRPEGIRSLYTSIIYIEPFSGLNPRAFGYDMYSEPVRRAAMEQARDSGKASISGKVRLVQETQKDVQTGFLMYLPVYKNGAPHGTVIERRANIIGWVNEVFRMGDLMRDIQGERASDLDYDIYDGKDISDKTLMYYSGNAFGNMRKAQFQASAGIDVAGHDWTMLLDSSPAFEKRLGTYITSRIIQSGIAISLLLFLMTWQLVTGRARALTMAQKLTRELTLNQKTLQLENDKNLALLHNASDGIHILDTKGNLIEASDLFCDMLGYRREEMIGMNVSQWDAGLSDSELKAVIRQQFAQHQRAQFVSRHRRRDGSIFDVEISGLPLLLDDKPVLFNSARDITERKKMDDHLRLLSSVFDHAEEGILITDKQGVILEANPACSRITGYSREELLGKNPRILHSGLQDQAFYDVMWREILENGNWSGEVWNRRKNGEIYPQMQSLSAVKNEAGETIRYIDLHSDISSRKIQQQQLERLAHYDALTGLPNRTLLNDRFEMALAQTKRSGGKLAACFMDLDGFKPVNDTFGHEVGDLLLVEVAQRMLTVSRDADTVARLAGDEFVLIFPGISDKAVCRQMLSRIVDSITQPFSINGHDIRISASIGVALYPDDDTNGDLLLRLADQAMYVAKQEGRNQFHFFDAATYAATDGAK